MTEPAVCRDVIRRRADTVSDPSLLRVFAIALLSAGDDTGVVEAMLARDPRNSITAAYLIDRQWRPPAVSDDFGQQRVDE